MAAALHSRHSGVVLWMLLDQLTSPAEKMDWSYLDDATAAEIGAEALHQACTLGTARIENYVEETVPKYSDPLFKAHFRMSRSSFQDLLELLGPHTPAKTISLEKRTLASLWCLSNQESLRGVADRFGMSKGSLHYCLMNICNILSGTLLPELVSWPSPRQYAAIADAFSARTGFPGVIGAIDGTYIPITGPSDFRNSFICRKGYPAFHLQGVCDSHLRFLDIYCGYPGSVHDARAFKSSPLYSYLRANPPPNNFHLLGDSAYGLTTFLLNPFRDNGHLTPQEKKYNQLHSSTRVDIERAFGLLKGKFRRLINLDMRRTRDMPKVITACCVLHNFILQKESFDETDIIVEEISSVITEQEGAIAQEAHTKRVQIMYTLA